MTVGRRGRPLWLLLVLGALLLPGCSLQSGPESICRQLLPGFVAPTDAAAITARTVDEADGRIVTLQWREALEGGGQRLDGLTCRFVDRRADGHGWRIAGLTSGTEGVLSTVQMMLLLRGLHLPAIDLLEALAPAANRPDAWPLDKHIAYFLQQTVNGITVGSLYALIAFGYTMVYGITGIINFAFGEFYMLGAFAAVIVFLLLSGSGLGLPVILVLVLVASMALTPAYGWVTSRLLYRPMYGATRLSPLIAAIGLSIALQEYARLLQGTHVVFLPPMGSQARTLYEGGGFTFQMSLGQALVIGTAALLMLALWLLITRTRFGRAQRACAQDRVMAEMVGIDVGRTVALTFMLGATLAAAAGMMVAIYYGGVEPYMGYLVGFKALTAALLGGIGSLSGAWVGGLLIGLFETYWSGYLDSLYRDVAVFSLLIMVLTLRPDGIAGQGGMTRLVNERI